MKPGQESWIASVRRKIEQRAVQSLAARDPDDETVVKTTRYLRLGMVALVVGLGTAVLYARFAPRRDGGVGGTCWQKSISAYYYTPAQSVFVAALVAVGISLIVLKGSTELEDLLLNFAGLFAPIIAFVPTPNPGTCGTIIDTTNRNFDIANNVFAMLLMAGAGLLTAVLLIPAKSPLSGTKIAKSLPDRPTRIIRRVGLSAALLLYVAVWSLYEGTPGWFRDNAHSFAAVTFFIFIFLTVVDNAINFQISRKKMMEEQKSRGIVKESDRIKPPGRVNRYFIIAIAMAIAVGFIKLVPIFGDYETIWLEAVMISLFAVFWIIQTHELWDRGLRTTYLVPGVDPVPDDAASEK